MGVPLFFFWFVAVSLGFVLAGKNLWIVFFFLLTLMGWIAYQPGRQLLVSGWNGIRFPGLRRKYLEFQRVLREEMRNHGF